MGVAERRRSSGGEEGVAEAKKEVEHEAEHKATFEELKELLCEGGEAEREGSTAIDTRLATRLP